MTRISDISIEEKVRFLRQPGSYGPAVSEVVVEETHMSWVFLVGERVYKLKKPVRYSFLDFSTLQAREKNCREEVRLNRRLAEDVYLGVVPLTLSAEGAFAVDGEGTTVDWLVLMRRLPLDRMLDQAIAARAVSRDEIVAVADRLSDFYEHVEPAELTSEAYVAQFQREQAQTTAVLTDHAFDLDGARIKDVLAHIDDILFNRNDLLKARVRLGRIVEGHGDLRPEHICLNSPPVIIDCLEFNRQFRLVDPVDELTYLALECRRLDDGWIGRLLLGRYAERRHEVLSTELVSFYWCYRACLRARLALVHILEHDRRNPEKWLPLAKQYLALTGLPEFSSDLRPVH